MGEQDSSGKPLTAEDCRNLLAEGRIAEGLDGLRAMVAAGEQSFALHHYLGVALHLSGLSAESLVHFDKAHELLADQAMVYQNQSIALLMAGFAERAETAAARAVQLRPGAVGGYVNLALSQVKLGKLTKADETIASGLALLPDHPGLLAQAAHIAVEMGKWDVAEERVSASLKAAPDSVDAHYNAGALHQARHREQLALAEFDAVLRLQPRHQAAFANKGVSLRNLGQTAAAIRHWTSGLEIWPDWNVLKYNLAITRLFAGDWTAGWPDYELRGEMAGAFDKSPRPRTPRWAGEEITDKTLLVICEQGFGDTFQFIRYLVHARKKAAKVIFAGQARLVPLLGRLDFFRKLGIQLVSSDQPLPVHDLHVPLLSLPGLIGTTPQTVPVGISRLTIEADRLEKWTRFAAWPDNAVGWRIGLSWQGNPSASVDRGRSIALGEFAPLSRLNGKARFVSLQKHFGVDQIVPKQLELFVPGRDFDAGTDAFVDTAALMMSLDLVITSDTAVAHLAGLLGRPVWLLLKKVPDWRWGGEGHLTPWYPTMRLFRQTADADWTSVLETVAEELDRLVVMPGEAATAAAARIPDAMDLHAKGLFDAAVEIYRAAHGARSRDARFLNFYAMAILEAGGRSQLAARSALAYVAHSLALAPGNGDLWSNAGVLMDSLGARSDSKRALRYGITVNPEHLPSIVALAKKDSADGQPEAALKTLLQVARTHPLSVPVLSALSSVYGDLGRQSEAVRALRRALELEPESARLWVQLGAALSTDGKPFEAAEAWEKALFHDPSNADAWSNLGVHERNHGSLSLSLYLQRRAVECDPQHAEGWNNLGIAELEAAHDAHAIAAFNRAISARPGYPDAHLALGMAMLNSGDFDRGLKHYEWRLKADKLGISANRPRLPAWTGGDPKDMSLFLMAEQGFGDAFQFARYARWLKERGAREVFIGCRAQIAHLLASIPGVDGVFSDGAKLPRADAMAYMMSMPALTGLQLDTIPAYESYMTADPVRVTRWAEWLAEKPGFRVGIVWQGNPDPKVDKGRSYPLSALEPLSGISGVRLIALQKGKGEEQIEALAGRFPVDRPPEDFDNGPHAFADTAAMMMNLDLVITSDTAVAHLAGALGRPCWVILKAHPEWRWLTDRSDSPWYPNTRLFRRFAREAEDQPFGAVVERVAAALSRLVAGDLAQRHVAGPETPGEILPHDPVTTFNTALEHQRGGHLEAAASAFAEVLDIKQLRPASLHMLGVLALNRDRNHRAVILFREAERAGLTTSEFLTNMAIGLRRTGRAEQAMECLNRAIAQKPTAEAYLSLGNILRDECRFAESADSYAAALDLRPDLAKAHRGMGNLMRDMHRPDESLACFEKARGLDPHDPDLILDHAHAKLFSGDFIGGFQDYEARWGSREMKARGFTVPRWDGTPLGDKTLLIHGEQGFGDNIQFVRFVEEARSRVPSVGLEVRGPLLSLFRRLDAGGPIDIFEQGREKPDFDVEIPMLSLPAVFGTTIDTVPPPARFAIDPDRIDSWRGRFPAGKMKVGLIWQGNPNARADQGRSPPLSALAPLFELPDVHFVSLQKRDGLSQVAAAPFAKDMSVPGEELGDFLETAAAILSMDLVISSCTATLHLAATLGVPVYGMLKYHADWRWMNERQDSPWYPSLRLFRQTRVLEWDGVVASLCDALRARLAAG